MSERSSVAGIVGYVWKPPLCALGFMIATMVGAPILVSLGVKPPALPSGVDPRQMAPVMLLGAWILALTLAPLAAGIRGSFPARWSVLCLFAYVSGAVNGAIEATVFTSMGGPGAALLQLPGFVLLTALAAMLFRPAKGTEAAPSGAASSFAPRSAQSWAWRLAAAVIAFPVIYHAFGMAIAPYVIEQYRQHVGGLKLPSQPVVIGVQTLRSLLFLGATLPVIAAWWGTRRSLACALALAFFGIVGLAGLVQASWLPVGMRAVHTAEILADSAVYACVLAALLAKTTAGGARSA
jgi:hypothetical protein